MEGDQALQRLSADYLSLLSGGGADGVGSCGELGGYTLSSDVSFCVEGRQVHAHRCILAARSHFFRLMFAAQAHDQTSPPAHSSQYLHMLSSSSFNNGRPPNIRNSPPLLIPVDVVGFDAFLSLLRFLYSGQLLLSLHHPSSPCPLPSCPHSSCSSAVDLLLQLIHAAHFFGVHQLADLVQIKLGNVLEEGVSVESLMKVLVMAKKHKMQHLWHSCTDLVIRTGLSCDILRRYLPREVITELGEMRLHTSQTNMQSCMSNNINYSLSDHLHSSQNVNSSPGRSCSMIMMCSINGGGCCNEEQRILRLQQALDCMDVELVRLMVMGEGLDLDKALALHYSVANCNRDVVKALLELGFVDVNYGDTLGRTALHLAADMGNAEMIAVLLDHHADPNALTREGFAAVDILRGLIKAGNHDHFHHHLNADHHPTVIVPLCKADQKRIHLCIELLQSAAAVAGREEAAESSCITQVVAQQAQIINSQLNQEAIGFMSRSLPLLRDDRLQPIITTDKLNQKTSRTSQSSPIAAAASIRDDRMQSIINTQYIQEAASAGSGGAGGPVTGLASAIDYHHRANPTRMSPQNTQINGIDVEASSLISSRGADNSYVNHCRSLLSSSYAGVLGTGLEPTNSGKIEYSATNTVTGSSSEE